jgi:hypothetical protein
MQTKEMTLFYFVGFPIIELRTFLDKHPCPTIDSALHATLPFQIPTAMSSTVNAWPTTFIRGEGSCAAAVDWWLTRSMDGDAEISVMSVDAGWINVIKDACSARVYRDQTHESSAGQTRTDATITRMNALVMKHEAKYSVEDLPLAVSELLFKLFPGVEMLFPRGSYDIIGIVSCSSLNQIHKITLDSTTGSFSTSLIGEYNVLNVAERVRFLIDIVKLCRWIISVNAPNSKFHLLPGQKIKTSNGHSITWCKEGLLKEFQTLTKRLRSGRGGDVSELSLGYINHVHSSRLPHVEWGYQPKGLLNAVMITRIGRRLIDVVSDGTLTNERILEDVRAGLTELHDLGYAHCDIRLENLFVDDNGVFLGDLEYLTPVKDPPPAHIDRSMPGSLTALEVDNKQFSEFIKKLVTLR